MSNHAWYTNQIPGISNPIPAFSRYNFDFYRNPQIVSDVKMFAKIYPNFFFYGRTLNDVKLSDYVYLFKRFADENRNMGITDTSLDFGTPSIESAAYFDTQFMNIMLENAVDSNPLIDIDFENRKHAFLYMPVSEIVRLPAPEKQAKEYKEWFPLDAQEVIYVYVQKFNLMKWEYEDQIFLLTEKFRKPKKKNVSLKREGMSMLDFIMK